MTSIYTVNTADKALYRIDTYEVEDWFTGEVWEEESETEIDINEFLSNADVEDWETELVAIGYDLDELDRLIDEHNARICAAHLAWTAEHNRAAA